MIIHHHISFIIINVKRNQNHINVLLSDYIELIITHPKFLLWDTVPTSDGSP